MADLDEARIKTLIEELDKLVPKEGGRLEIEQYGGGPDESEMTGNKTGYLRFGLAFLKGAISNPMPKTPEYLDIDLEGIVSEGSDIQFDNFRITETFQAPPPVVESVRDKVSGFFIGALILSFPIFAIIGFLTTVYLVVGNKYFHIRF